MYKFLFIIVINYTIIFPKEISNSLFNNYNNNLLLYNRSINFSFNFTALPNSDILNGTYYKNSKQRISLEYYKNRYIKNYKSTLTDSLYAKFISKINNKKFNSNTYDYLVDSSDNSFGINLNYDASIFKIITDKHHFHTEFFFDNTCYTAFNTIKPYDPYINPSALSDSLKQQLFAGIEYQSNFIINSRNSLKVDLGFGELDNRISLIKALQINKYLIKNNIIPYTLSDNTIHSIENILSKYTIKSLRKLDTILSLKKILDSILLNDMAMKKYKLHFFSVLDLKKILLSRKIEINSGNRIDISVSTRFTIESMYSSHSYPYIINSEDRKKWELNYNHHEAIILNYNFAKIINSSIYFSLNSQRVFLDTDREINFKNSTNFNWDNILEAIWDFNTIFCPGNRGLIKFSIINLPAYLLIPNALPQNFVLEMGIYIESNIYIFSKSTINSNNNIRFSYYDNLQNINADDTNLTNFLFGIMYSF